MGYNVYEVSGVLQCIYKEMAAGEYKVGNYNLTKQANNLRIITSQLMAWSLRFTQSQSTVTLKDCVHEAIFLELTSS